jgi:hypothetical protein
VSNAPKASELIPRAGRLEVVRLHNDRLPEQ